MTEGPDPRSEKASPGRPLVLLACGSCALLSLCVASGLIAFFALRGDGKTQGSLSAKGGRLELGEVSIEAPEGAVPKDRRVSVALIEPPSSPDKNIGAASRAFEIEADGGPFEKDIALELAYDPALVPAGAEERLSALCWTGRGWEPVESSVDRARHRVVAKTRHLSTWIVGFTLSAVTFVRHHPKLPYDVAVAESLHSKLAPGFIDAVSSSVETAWNTLTTRNPTRPWMLAEPPNDASKRLVFIITDLSTPEAKKEYHTEQFGGAGGLTLSDELVLLQWDDQGVGRVWPEPVHEFVHAIQFRYEKRARELGEPSGKKPWIDEATAVYLQSVVAPQLEGNVVLDHPGFSFEELTYHSQYGPPRKGSELHQYEGAVFIDYAVFRFGARFVGTLFDDAYVGPKDDREALEAAIHDASHGAETLASLYKDFVLAHEHTHAFGARPFYVGKPGVLSPPAEKIDTLEAESTPRSLTIAAGALVVPRVVRVQPRRSAPGPCTVELGLASGLKPENRWMWAFAPTGGGAYRLLGGDPSRLVVRLDADANEVLVYPVSMAAQALVVTARLGAADESPPSSGLSLGLAPGCGTDYAHALFASFTLDFNRSLDERRALAQRLGNPKWFRIELEVRGKKHTAYAPFYTDQPSIRCHEFVPVRGEDPIEVVATCRLAGEVMTVRRTFVPNPAHLESCRKALARAKRDLAQAEASSRSAGHDVSKPGSLSEWHNAVGDAALALGDLALANEQWTAAGESNATKFRRADLALEVGDVERYEALVREAGGTLDFNAMAAAEVHVQDDLEKAWRIMDAHPDRGYPSLPRRGDVIAR